MHTIPGITKIRQELEQLVLTDLLCLANGSKEIVDEPTAPRRYIVVVLFSTRSECQR